MIARSKTQSAAPNEKNEEAKKTKRAIEVVPVPDNHVEVSPPLPSRPLSTPTSSSTPASSAKKPTVTPPATPPTTTDITSQFRTLALAPCTEPTEICWRAASPLHCRLHNGPQSPWRLAKLQVASEVHKLIQSSLRKTATFNQKLQGYLLDPRTQTFDVMELLAFESSHLGREVGLWGCFECLRLRSVAGFTDIARSGDLSKEGKLRHTRFCIDCGRTRLLENGRVRYDREDVLYVMGKPHTTCHWCERFGSVAQLVGREGNKDVKRWTCGECFVDGGVKVEGSVKLDDEQPWGPGF